MRLGVGAGGELKEAKRLGFSDAYLARAFGVTLADVRARWKAWGWAPSYKLVDTCAAEFDAETPYYYATWCGVDEVEPLKKERKVLVIGSGPIRIGQGIEFDYCAVHAAKALKKMGVGAVVINNNPETVSTDFETADQLYFDPLTVEDVLNVAEKEGVDGVSSSSAGRRRSTSRRSWKPTGSRCTARRWRPSAARRTARPSMPCCASSTSRTFPVPA
jgi:Carbamoylphosphate synthase large subunit (split gene in MJ)